MNLNSMATKIKIENLKKNDAGELLFWGYNYLNTHTGKRYCGVTVDPSNRKSIWKNLNYKYAGEKVYQARKQYHDWANDWIYTETEYSAKSFDVLLSEMVYTECYLISYYDSFRDGYNSNPGGGGRSSKSRILVIEKDGTKRIFNSCEDVARTYTMSPGNVYHYVYKVDNHTKKNGMIFLPIDDSTTISALSPTFITTYSITLP